MLSCEWVGDRVEIRFLFCVYGCVCLIMCVRVYGVGVDRVCDITCNLACGAILGLPLRISPKKIEGRGF